MGRKKDKKKAADGAPGAAKSEKLEFVHEGSSAGFGMMVLGLAWVIWSTWSLFIAEGARPGLGSFPIVLAGTLPVLIGGFIALTRTVSFHSNEKAVRVTRRLVYFRWAEVIPFDRFEKVWIWSPKPGAKDAERRHELILTGPYSVLLKRGAKDELRAIAERIRKRSGVAFGEESA